MKLQWKIWKTNFNNILYSMNTLLIISSLDNWPTIMFRCMDSNYVDKVYLFY